METQQNETGGITMSFAAVAITTAVVGAGAAVAGGVMQSQAAGRGAKRQEQASAALQQQTKEATDKFVTQQEEVRKKVNEIDPTINIPEYNLEGATLEGIKAANRVTANTLQQLEQIAPGSAQARQQVGQIIGSYLRGEVPRDVQEQITRMTAERAGAGFVPMAGRGPSGFQSAQGQLARNLGLTSLQLQEAGMNSAQTWQQTAASFIQNPTQMMAFSLTGRGQDIGVQQQNIRNLFAQQEMISGINLGQYQAITGQADTAYQAQSRANEARYAADASFGQSLGQIGGGLMSFAGGMASGGAFSGGGGGFQYGKTPMGAGGGSVGGVGTFGPNYGYAYGR